MSQGALDRPTFEAIEAYVLDRMTLAERQAFEHRMASDSAFRAEVELERENIQAVELGGMTRTLRGIAAEEHRGQRAGDRAGYLKYAAAIAVLVVGGLWWAMRPSANEKLFAEHYVADPGLPVAMSATDDPAFADAMVSYKEGEYAKARAKWSPLLQQEPTNDTLRYYIASSWLAEGDAEAAIPMFEGLASNPGSVFQAHARWFLFLAYVRTGDIAGAEAVDLDRDTLYGERAREIKSKLRD